MNLLRNVAALFFLLLTLVGNAQVCDSTNSPSFKIRISALNPAVNGTCGILIYIDSLVSSVPGGVVNYHVFAPNSPTVWPYPPQSVTLAIGNGIYTAIAWHPINSCITTKTIQITIPQAPTISVSTSLTPLCSAQANFLVASGASSYTWHTGSNGPSIVTNPASSLSYTVRGANSAGCQAVLQGSFVALPSPTIIPVPNQFSVCINQSVLFTPQGAGTYTLNNAPIGNQFTSPTFTSLGNTTYSFTLKGTNSVGCTSTVYYSQSFFVDQCDVGIEEASAISEQNKIVIYPNPVEKSVWIKMQNSIPIKSVSLSDIAGKQIACSSHELYPNAMLIDVSTLVPGLYYITIATEEGSTIKKIQKH